MRTASFLSLGALASALLLVLAQAPTAAGAIKDTIKNRLKMAEQFLEENPVEDSIEATARCVCGSDDQVLFWLAWLAWA